MIPESFEVERVLPKPTAKSIVIFLILFSATAFTMWLVAGVWFSLSLMFILTAHEFGHYWASRKNNVDTTLPFFLPAPPIFIFGTFGAFIKIRDPIPDRRALMEIGAAGPIAGFVVAVPVLGIGVYLSDVIPALPFEPVSFGSSLILVAASQLILGVSPFSTELTILLHPIALAGWIGMFITALNLLPISQLDGGHIIYSLWVEKHSLLAKVFFGLLFPLAWFWPGWLVWAVLIVLLGFRHPPVLVESLPLEKKHRVMGYVSIFIFILTFIPIPIEVIL